MDDMISKQQAVNALYEWEFDNKDDRDAIDVINGLPPIQPEPHWIPVTEQPPEVGKSVLICDAYDDICLGHRTHFGYYYPDFCDDKIKDVRAWCELPEPYKGVTT